MDGNKALDSLSSSRGSQIGKTSTHKSSTIKGKPPKTAQPAENPELNGKAQNKKLPDRDAKAINTNPSYTDTDKQTEILSADDLLLQQLFGGKKELKTFYDQGTKDYEGLKFDRAALQKIQKASSWDKFRYFFKGIPQTDKTYCTLPSAWWAPSFHAHFDALQKIANDSLKKLNDDVLLPLDNKNWQIDLETQKNLAVHQSDLEALQSKIKEVRTKLANYSPSATLNVGTLENNIAEQVKELTAFEDAYKTATANLAELKKHKNFESSAASQDIQNAFNALPNLGTQFTLKDLKEKIEIINQFNTDCKDTYKKNLDAESKKQSTSSKPETEKSSTASAKLETVKEKIKEKVLNIKQLLVDFKNKLRPKEYKIPEGPYIKPSFSEPTRGIGENKGWYLFAMERGDKNQQIGMRVYKEKGQQNLQVSFKIDGKVTTVTMPNLAKETDRIIKDGNKTTTSLNQFINKLYKEIKLPEEVLDFIASDAVFVSNDGVGYLASSIDYRSLFDKLLGIASPYAELKSMAGQVKYNEQIASLADDLLINWRETDDVSRANRLKAALQATQELISKTQDKEVLQDLYHNKAQLLAALYDGPGQLNQLTRDELSQTLTSIDNMPATKKLLSLLEGNNLEPIRDMSLFYLAEQEAKQRLENQEQTLSKAEKALLEINLKLCANHYEIILKENEATLTTRLTGQEVEILSQVTYLDRVGQEEYDKEIDYIKLAFNPKEKNKVEQARSIKRIADQRNKILSSAAIILEKVKPEASQVEIKARLKNAIDYLKNKNSLTPLTKKQAAEYRFLTRQLARLEQLEKVQEGSREYSFLMLQFQRDALDAEPALKAYGNILKPLLDIQKGASPDNFLRQLDQLLTQKRNELETKQTALLEKLGDSPSDIKILEHSQDIEEINQLEQQIQFLNKIKEDSEGGKITKQAYQSIVEDNQNRAESILRDIAAEQFRTQKLETLDRALKEIITESGDTLKLDNKEANEVVKQLQSLLDLKQTDAETSKEIAMLERFIRSVDSVQVAAFNAQTRFIAQPIRGNLESLWILEWQTQQALKKNSSETTRKNLENNLARIAAIKNLLATSVNSTQKRVVQMPREGLEGLANNEVNTNPSADKKAPNVLQEADQVLLNTDTLAGGQLSQQPAKLEKALEQTEEQLQALQQQAAKQKQIDDALKQKIEQQQRNRERLSNELQKIGVKPKQAITEPSEKQKAIEDKLEKNKQLEEPIISEIFEKRKQLDQIEQAIAAGLDQGDFKAEVIQLSSAQIQSLAQKVEAAVKDVQAILGINSFEITEENLEFSELRALQKTLQDLQKNSTEETEDLPDTAFDKVAGWFDTMINKARASAQKEKIEQDNRSLRAQAREPEKQERVAALTAVDEALKAEKEFLASISTEKINSTVQGVVDRDLAELEETDSKVANLFADADKTNRVENWNPFENVSEPAQLVEPTNPFDEVEVVKTNPVPVPEQATKKTESNKTKKLTQAATVSPTLSSKPEKTLRKGQTVSAISQTGTVNKALRKGIAGIDYPVCKPIQVQAENIAQIAYNQSIQEIESLFAKTNLESQDKIKLTNALARTEELLETGLYKDGNMMRLINNKLLILAALRGIRSARKAQEKAHVRRRSSMTMAYDENRSNLAGDLRINDQKQKSETVRALLRAKIQLENIVIADPMAAFIAVHDALTQCQIEYNQNEDQIHKDNIQKLTTAFQTLFQEVKDFQTIVTSLKKSMAKEVKELKPFENNQNDAELETYNQSITLLKNTVSEKADTSPYEILTTLLELQWMNEHISADNNADQKISSDHRKIFGKILQTLEPRMTTLESNGQFVFEIMKKAIGNDSSFKKFKIDRDSKSPIIDRMLANNMGQSSTEDNKISGTWKSLQTDNNVVNKLAHTLKNALATTVPPLLDKALLGLLRKHKESSSIDLLKNLQEPRYSLFINTFDFFATYCYVDKQIDLESLVDNFALSVTAGAELKDVATAREAFKFLIEQWGAIRGTLIDAKVRSSEFAKIIPTTLALQSMTSKHGTYNAAIEKLNSNLSTWNDAPLAFINETYRLLEMTKRRMDEKKIAPDAPVENPKKLEKTKKKKKSKALGEVKPKKVKPEKMGSSRALETNYQTLNTLYQTLKNQLELTLTWANHQLDISEGRIKID